MSCIRSIDLRLTDGLVDFVRGPGFVLVFPAPASPTSLSPS